MEGGCDVESFMEFMESKKENGTDIDNWSLHELKVLV